MGETRRDDEATATKKQRRARLFCCCYCYYYVVLCVRAFVCVSFCRLRRVSAGVVLSSAATTKTATIKSNKNLVCCVRVSFGSLSRVCVGFVDEPSGRQRAAKTTATAVAVAALRSSLVHAKHWKCDAATVGPTDWPTAEAERTEKWNTEQPHNKQINKRSHSRSRSWRRCHFAAANIDPVTAKAPEPSRLAQPTWAATPLGQRQMLNGMFWNRAANKHAHARTLRHKCIQKAEIVAGLILLLLLCLCVDQKS